MCRNHIHTCAYLKTAQLVHVHAPTFHDYHTIFCCARMKSTTQEKGTVWSDGLHVMHLQHAADMTNVYGTTQIVAAALHVKNGTPENCFIFRTVLPTIHTENTDQLRSGLWLIEADGRSGQMSVAYYQVRLAATGIKLHLMLLRFYV